MLKTVITTVTFSMEHAEKLFKQTAIGPSHNSQKENNMQIASCMITKIIIIHHGLLIYDNSLLLHGNFLKTISNFLKKISMYVSRLVCVSACLSVITEDTNMQFASKCVHSLSLS